MKKSPMMYFRHARLCGFLLAIALGAMAITPVGAQVAPPSPAQPKPDKTPKAPAAPPVTAAAAAPVAESTGSVRIFLMDGSILHGKITTPEFTLTTDFGTLKFPAKSVTGLMPGLDSHPKLRSRINELIDDLTSGDEQKVGKAAPELTHMGEEVIQELTSAQIRIKGEGAQHALQEVIDSIREAEIEEGDLESNFPFVGMPLASALISEDSISTAKFTAVGKLQPQMIAVTTSFGDVTIKLAEVKRVTMIDAPAQEQVASVTVTIVNGQQDAFKSTGMTLVPGDKLIFHAKGQLKMSPWDDSITASPEGESENCGFAMPNVPQGALVGRIGSGPVFKIGTKLNITADRPGPLKIGIGIDPSMWSNILQRIKGGEAPAGIMAGDYDVRINHQPRK